MPELLYRYAPLEQGDGRTIFGRAVPYGQVTKAQERSGRIVREKFEYGAFGRSIRERGHKVHLRVEHNAMSLPIGVAESLEERSDGLHAEFRVSDTSDGNDALRLVSDGVLDAFSIGFVPIKHRWDDDVIVRTEASLREVSIVADPAYEGAEVAGVRSSLGRILTADIARRRLNLILEKKL